jgi:hypothetical protein
MPFTHFRSKRRVYRLAKAPYSRPPARFSWKSVGVKARSGSEDDERQDEERHVAPLKVLQPAPREEHAGGDGARHHRARREQDDAERNAALPEEAEAAGAVGVHGRELEIERGDAAQEPSPPDHAIDPAVEQELEDRHRDERVPPTGRHQVAAGRRVPRAALLKGGPGEIAEGRDVRQAEHDQLRDAGVAESDRVPDDVGEAVLLIGSYEPGDDELCASLAQPCTDRDLREKEHGNRHEKADVRGDVVEEWNRGAAGGEPFDHREHQQGHPGHDRKDDGRAARAETEGRELQPPQYGVARTAVGQEQRRKAILYSRVHRWLALRSHKPRNASARQVAC